MNFINSLNQKEAPREEVPLFCLQSESRTALKPFRSFSSDNHRPSGLVRIPIICKLKNSGTILVCHLTRIGDEKSAHCLTGITGQHSTFLLFDAISLIFRLSTPQAFCSPANAVRKSSGLDASFIPIALAILMNCPSQACRSTKKR